MPAGGLLHLWPTFGQRGQARSFCANKGFKLNDETTKALGRSSAPVYALQAQLLNMDWKRTRAYWNGTQ